MTGPGNASTATGSPALRWFMRPPVMIASALVLLVVVTLFAPDVTNGRSGDPRLTTYSTQPQGAGIFYQLAGRLGWVTSRRLTPDVVPDSTAIQAVLAPAVALRVTEIHALLDAARRGGALLLVLPPRASALSDSLHLTLGAGAEYLPPDSLGGADCPKPGGGILPLWPNDEVQLYALRWTGPAPAGLVEFARVTTRPPDAASRPAVVGFPLGRGRVVVASDPDLLRNDAIRFCENGLSVVAVQALEYLRDGGASPRTHIVFDEYHQGFGAQPGTVTAIAAYLGRTPSGHVLFQLLAAGLVLLVAAAPRALAPRDVTRVERRSPFEHVDALARAYAQVRATRTATVRMLRGVRRRAGGAGTSGRRDAAGRTDEEFLERAVRLHPALAADAARVRHAMADDVSRHELAEVRDALRHIESSLTSLPS